ncbi:hypothetical protein AVEN_190193-1 [Araneus ventricosus]|uniref:Uncharacterized protein n=1 Tax=Araneus ventricosus TaxID=182803 RepID=A0A4Y2UNN3_ARAVE|nr:hypothetical protein AVEN_190193-1 [Araneus ventricosus]
MRFEIRHEDTKFLTSAPNPRFATGRHESLKKKKILLSKQGPRRIWYVPCRRRSLSESELEPFSLGVEILPPDHRIHVHKWYFAITHERGRVLPLMNRGLTISFGVADFFFQILRYL